MHYKEPQEINLLNHSEENMEEILASIRKIMASSSQESLDQDIPSAKEPLPSSAPSISEAEKKNVLILTKKSPFLPPKSFPEPSSQKLRGSSVSSENTVFETLVSSSLSPLIQNWLDKNLETVVEKVVKEELKKLFSPNQQ